MFTFLGQSERTTTHARSLSLANQGAYGANADRMAKTKWCKNFSYKDHGCHCHFYMLKVTKSTKKLSWYWQTRATRLEVSQGHQTWYHSIC